VKGLKDKEKWKESESVFGLLKLKVLKFRLKKEKAAPEAAEGAEGAVAAEGAVKAPAAGEVKAATKETKAAAKKEAPKKEQKRK